jgi:hypothetical protein
VDIRPFEKMKNYFNIICFYFFEIYFKLLKKIICTPGFNTFLEMTVESKNIACKFGDSVRTTESSRRHSHCNGSFLNLNWNCLSFKYGCLNEGPNFKTHE